jgi:hypothetical protein
VKVAKKKYSVLFDPKKLLVIAGPCSLEGERVCRAVAETLVKIARAQRAPVCVQGLVRQSEPHLARGRARHGHRRGARAARDGENATTVFPC